MTSKQTLIDLFIELRIQGSQLLITDAITGAGYIMDREDNVIVRWGSYEEAIAVLEAYLVAYSIKKGFDKE